MFAILVILNVLACKSSSQKISKNLCGDKPTLLYFRSGKTYTDDESNQILTNNIFVCEKLNGCYDKLTRQEQIICDEI